MSSRSRRAFKGLGCCVLCIKPGERRLLDVEKLLLPPPSGRILRRGCARGCGGGRDEGWYTSTAVCIVSGAIKLVGSDSCPTTIHNIYLTSLILFRHRCDLNYCASCMAPSPVLFTLMFLHLFNEKKKNHHQLLLQRGVRSFDKTKKK